MLTLFRFLFIAIIVGMFYLIWNDCRKNGPDLKTVPMGERAAYAIMGFVLNLIDTLGVGSNATQAAFFKLSKLSPDEELPGNGNVIFCVPVAVEALLFFGLIEVEPVTLFTMLIAAMLGGMVGGRIIAHLPVQKIRTILSVTLPLVAIVLVCKINGFGPFGILGTETGLTGSKLITAILLNFVFGVLMNAGVGLYAPCMALCAMLGMNVSVAFPIMMGSCALLMPFSSWEFIKAGRYNRKAAVIATITGVFGVLVAYYIVKSMPIKALTYIVAGVLIYMSASFILSNRKDKAAGDIAEPKTSMHNTVGE